jgi:sterol desaturase/sphingolipid hydroxylase (fatty acid hydroxylase superfamily)
MPPLPPVKPMNRVNRWLKFTAPAPPDGLQATGRSRRRRLPPLWLSLGVLLGLVMVGMHWQVLTTGKWPSETTSAISLLKLQLKQTLYTIRAEIVFNPLFYGLTLGILLLEWRFPAKPRQPLLSLGFWQDAVWLFCDFLVTGFLINPYVELMLWFHTQVLHGFTIPLPQVALPGVVRLGLAVLITDFAVWLSHLVVHKVPFFWQFHAVHHSQRQLNLFTSLRLHALDILFNILVNTPLLILLAVPSMVQAYALFRVWYARLYHANIKSNLGFLRYIFVTPQSHRVHHSIAPQHYDRNFGLIFSIWDQIFGTQYRRYNEYPDTGIADPHFPIEFQANPIALLKTYWAQWAYPFLSWLVRSPPPLEQVSTTNSCGSVTEQSSDP